MKIKASILIVHYKADKEFFDCLDSIKKNKPKENFEVIVADNDEIAVIDKKIKKAYPWVKYVKSPGNVGYGAGNNLAAKHAKGEYLFILNPDTIVFPNTINSLIEFLNKNNDAAVVAPLLLDNNKKPFPLQGTATLTPLRAIFGLSLVNKFFPNNSIAKEFWMTGWDKTRLKEVDVVPGTAFMIRKKIYDEVDGFDEHFFLYFDENDLCKRIKEKGYKIFISPKPKLIHLWGKGGTDVTNNIPEIFKQSRYYYFKKHYGFLTAQFVSFFLNFGKTNVFLLGILILTAFLLFYKLSDLMMFIGDQGFFYLSARDILLHGQIPLVGITSSHTWLHQGPLWTYMLAGALWLGHFNPVSGAYLTATLGLVTVFLVYKIGAEMFSRRVGLIASLLYATSPLTVFFARMPYHTAPIAILTLLLFFAIYKWINGYRYGIPVILLLFALLYNFETATFMLLPIFVLILLYGIIKKTPWVKNILNKKILLLALLGYIIPMIPMILYDVHHGYPQTLRFAEWVVYKIGTIFGFPKIHPEAPGETYQTMLPFASEIVQRMIFLKSSLIAWLILLINFITLVGINYSQWKNRRWLQPYSLLFLFFFFPSIAYIAEKTNSDAYWIVFFPTVAFMLALVFDRLMRLKNGFYPTLILLFLFVFLNISALFQSNFIMGANGYGPTYSQKLAVAKQIIRQSDGGKYTIMGVGPGSQYISYTMQYQYLTWWLGHGPADSRQKLKFAVKENQYGIAVKKEIKE